MPADVRPPQVALAWANTLTEPLLRLSRRAMIEDAMLAMCRQTPDFGPTFFGGVVADLIQTLPLRDPWRHVSARIGTVATGQDPPSVTGAVRADGAVFGTVADHTDRVPILYLDPVDDPGLMAVADPLSPLAAAVLASGNAGWGAARDMVEAARAQQPPTGVAVIPGWETGVMIDSASSAIRWLIHRRRSYRGKDDTWPTESAHRWAARVPGLLAGIPLESIAPGPDTSLAAEQCYWEPFDDFDPNDF